MKTGISVDDVRAVLKGTEFADYNVAYVEEGVSTDVFRLTKDRVIYLRILPKEETAETQCLAHELMLKKNLHIPQVLFSINKVKEFNNRSLMIVEEIPGTSLKKTKKELTKNQIHEIMVSAGRELAKINTIHVKGVGWMEGVEKGMLKAMGKSYEDFIIDRNTTYLQDLYKIKVITQLQSEKIQNYVNMNKYLLDIKESSYLCHGDFGIDHIYQNEGKYSGIIDFGDIRGTSIFHDLSHVYIFDRSYFDSLVDGYVTVTELPSDFIEKVKIESVILGVSKLWWVTLNRPYRAVNHPALDLFDELT